MPVRSANVLRAEVTRELRESTERIEAMVGGERAQRAAAAGYGTALGLLVAKCEATVRDLVEDGFLSEAWRATECIAEIEWRSGASETNIADAWRNEVNELLGRSTESGHQPMSSRLAQQLARLDRLWNLADRAEQEDRLTRALSLWQQAWQAAMSVGRVTRGLEALVRQGALLERLRAGRVPVQRVSFQIGAAYTQLVDNEKVSVAELRRTLVDHWPRFARELAVSHAERAEAREREQSAKALDDWEAAAALEPDSSRRLSRLAWALLTRDPVSPDERARALALSEQACAISHNGDWFACAVRAAAYGSLGNDRDAAAWAAQARALAPQEEQGFLDRLFPSG